MNKMKRLLAMIIAIATVLSMGAMLGGCGKDKESTETGAAGEAGSYSVSVKTAGGMAMEGIAVYVYADTALSDLQDYKETDENGNASFNLAAGTHYISLGGVPKGYAVESYYSFEGNSAEIVLTSSLVTDDSLSNVTLGLGDVMYDFSVVTPGGETVKLSEMLEQKDVVLLNFWFSTCGPCANEFPYMDEAYQMYQDKVGVIAVDPLEDNNTVGTYQSSMGLTFPMAACPAAWSQTFGISGYPTSIIIDRYGVICLIEVGGITSLSPFTSIFETFTAEDYQQKLYTSVSELVTRIKPTFEMDTSENIAAIINNGDLNITYRPETESEDAEYSWPFIAAEKNGEQCIKASNQQVDDSYAIIYMDVELKAGQALGFDYMISSELGADYMHVIVNDESMLSMSGYAEAGSEKWVSAYPCVAEKDGTYEVALCYLKDSDGAEGDDTVYIKNVRITGVDEIEVPTYIPSEAATTEDGFEYEYVSTVYNEKDGYYHVGSADGPLLLANLMDYSQFNEEGTVWEMACNGDFVLDGHDYAEELTKFAQYASNNQYGVCTVNKDLAEILKTVAQIAGFDQEDENEWLKMCVYYKVYGTDVQFEDPIKGLATYSAYTATEGKDVATNYFYYDRIIMPRGLLAEFVPSKSGVYRITSECDNEDGVEGWIFDENGEIIYTYAHDERMFEENTEVSMVYYMEAGKSYYIDIAFWDPYAVGYVYYDVEYVAKSMELFRLCSPGYFTYDTDATGEAMYDVISGGINVVLGSDGYYYEDLGNGKTGSKIYCDFTGLTGVFDTPIATVGDVKGMIEKGGFDFSKTENDQYILNIMANNGNDKDKTIAYLKELWGEDYDGYAEEYQLDDVFDGVYHGTGEDYTAKISAYLDKIITTGSEEIQGCVAVDENLAKILQALMDKFTFEDVQNSWTKLCYYYDYLGA